jgi:hypothetical protein
VCKHKYCVCGTAILCLKKRTSHACTLEAIGTRQMKKQVMRLASVHCKASQQVQKHLGICNRGARHQLSDRTHTRTHAPAAGPAVAPAWPLSSLEDPSSPHPLSRATYLQRHHLQYRCDCCCCCHCCCCCCCRCCCCWAALHPH